MAWRRLPRAVLETIQREGTGKDAGHLIETFGPISLIIKLLANEDGLSFQIIHARMFGIPLIKWASPTLGAREWAEDGWYRFSVTIGVPVFGRLIQYEGRLRVKD